MFKSYFDEYGTTQLPPEIMKYLRVYEGDKVGFEFTALGLIILRKVNL